MKLLRGLALGALVATCAAFAQEVRIEHFAQRGERWDALAKTLSAGTARIVLGGLGRQLAGIRTSTELTDALRTRLAAIAVAPDEVLPVVQARRAFGEALPFVSCNVLDERGTPALKSHVVREIAGQRIAFLGVTGHTGRAQELPVGWRIDDPGFRLRDAVTAAVKECDRVVVLSTGDLAQARELVAYAPSEIVVIALGTRSADPEPQRHRGSILVTTAQNGTSIATLELTWAGSEPPRVRHAFRAVHLDAAERETLGRLTLARASPRERLAASRPTSRPVLGLGSVGLTPAEVQAAVARGANALWKYVVKHDLWNEQRPFGSQEQHWLVALALVHAKHHLRDREFDLALRGALAAAEPRKLGTYAAGIFCMLVEDLGDPRSYPQLREAVRMLIESQGPSGSWGYGLTLPNELFDRASDGSPLVVNNGLSLDDPLGVTETWTRITAPSFGGDGDNSSSQFALLGLRSATRLGIRVPAATWRSALHFYCRNQARGGGWAYVSSDDSTAYGSMTLAGISALALCRHELSLEDPTVDERLARALEWIASRFQVDANPNEKAHIGYYLYSLERTGRILGTEHFGDHEWYPRGCKHLLSIQQKDGLWSIDPSEHDPRLASSFALLFLTRATSSLQVEIPRGGTGRFRADVAIPPKQRVYFVLDASGSMLEALGKGTKFDAARDAIARVSRILAPGAKVALRAYGHRRRALEPEADTDTELLVKTGPLDHAEFQKKLGALRARGKTPLAASLAETEKDLQPLASTDAPLVVVLLSDGGEDTTVRRDPVVAATKLAALPGVTLHVVGFDIGREEWRTQLQAIAQAGRGSYFAAARGEDLAKAVRDTFLRCPDGFVLEDPTGREVARGAFGEEIEVPEGSYVFVTAFRGETWRRKVWINTGRVSSVTFRG